jgi:protein TonB
MEASKILTVDILDILFEGRNKAYGAYDLRKTYNKRMMTAMVITVVLITVLLLSYIISSNMPEKEINVIVGPDIMLEEIKPEEKKVEPPPPPPLALEPPKVEMVRSTFIIIVKDEEVKEDEKPPEVEKLEESKIGAINQEGIKDDEIVAPPVNYAGKGIIEAPKKDETDYEMTFEKVEIESLYPGGAGAWMRYLNKTFRYPQEAQDNEIQGTVVVQFIVDREGNVSDVEAVSGPSTGGLREEAIRVIKKSGKWEPAVQNGRKVKSYKKQPITFRLEVE